MRRAGEKFTEESISKVDTDDLSNETYAAVHIFFGNPLNKKDFKWKNHIHSQRRVKAGGSIVN